MLRFLIARCSDKGISSNTGRKGCLVINVNSVVNDSAKPKWHDCNGNATLVGKQDINLEHKDKKK